MKVLLNKDTGITVWLTDSEHHCCSVKISSTECKIKTADLSHDFTQTTQFTLLCQAFVW